MKRKIHNANNEFLDNVSMKIFNPNFLEFFPNLLYVFSKISLEGKNMTFYKEYNSFWRHV